jgi:hypothetical protein
MPESRKRFKSLQIQNKNKNKNNFSEKESFIDQTFFSKI